ncbi:serine protease [Clavibacter tessellarius]|uniref:Serine protease n=1 Tax=Clavibacter tessellarius TaxID=31965 RepID=A0A225C9I9_9MICO|nr:serine protease [Clavibacter michiganensis]OQJ63427.1 serine protease [Clavibacter michiganensis subsp. tessellarius]UKF33597.1 serine protease [Clavibacter michiganensis subsp. tessellarius]
MPCRPALSARRPLAAVAVLGLTAALLGVASAASADEASGAVVGSSMASAEHASPVAGTADAPDSVAVDVTSAQAADAVAFWTPERRAVAIDADARTSSSTSTADDAARSDAARTDAVGTDAAADSSRAVQVAPVSHIGRMYYMQAGVGYACTANVVESANRSTLATAGHCITQNQVFSDHMVFYPGFDSGPSASGAWPVITGYVPYGWYERNAGDQFDDSGFLAVKRDASGRDIQSVVGASPVLFDQSNAERAAVYGYPATGRFDGRTLQRCGGLTEGVSVEEFALPCDMNAGSSGSPVFAGDGADGAQFANVAEHYGDSSHVLGPVWQGTEHDAYDLAAAVAN